MRVIPCRDAPIFGGPARPLDSHNSRAACDKRQPSSVSSGCCLTKSEGSEVA
jgi:hypothetical protein